VILALALIGLHYRGTRGFSTVQLAFGFGWLVVLSLAALPAGVQRWALAPLRRHRSQRSPHQAPADPLTAVRQDALAAGGAVYLGVGQEGRTRYARSERAVLLLGPPRAGKTSGVIIPALI